MPSWIWHRTFFKPETTFFITPPHATIHWNFALGPRRQLPSAEPPDIVPQPPTPPEGLSMLQAVLRHTRKSRFARRGRSASPDRGLAVLSSLFWGPTRRGGVEPTQGWRTLFHALASPETWHFDVILLASLKMAGGGWTLGLRGSPPSCQWAGDFQPGANA